MVIFLTVNSLTKELVSSMKKCINVVCHGSIVFLRDGRACVRAVLSVCSVVSMHMHILTSQALRTVVIIAAAL
jgi:hypothetical protein